MKRKIIYLISVVFLVTTFASLFSACENGNVIRQITTTETTTPAETTTTTEKTVIAETTTTTTTAVLPGISVHRKGEFNGVALFGDTSIENLIMDEEGDFTYKSATMEVSGYRGFNGYLDFANVYFLKLRINNGGVTVEYNYHLEKTDSGYTVVYTHEEIINN